MAAVRSTRGDRLDITSKATKCTIWRGLEGFGVIRWLGVSRLAESHHRHGWQAWRGWHGWQACSGSERWQAMASVTGLSVCCFLKSTHL
ncbi:hypothetical protein [Microcoleus sp. Pol12B5]|uniref:hypothetical protein n=1 Tax=Microcoleus sp. Pol12B5 TaxID=3055396 RepID=UPI002FD71010